jgi:hypothetical protein
MVRPACLACLVVTAVGYGGRADLSDPAVSAGGLCGMRQCGADRIRLRWAAVPAVGGVRVRW